MRCATALLLAVLACAGCSQHRVQRVPGPATPTAAEQALIERMTADPFVLIARADRDGQGRLLITTRQGDQTIRYLAVRPADGSDRLVAMRAADQPMLEVADDGTRGTGPDRRGLGSTVSH
jgi:hypothetical protein